MVQRLVFAGLMILVGVGCQTTSQRSASSLPAPTFDAPPVTLRAALPPPPPAAPTQAVSASGQANPSSGVPRGWAPPVKARPWRWIVIHHSATDHGGAKAFDKMHRDKGWDELGYHFVIGNGTDTPDGMVEVGSRWPKQKYGAHCKTPDNRYNEYGIGICLVGNFDNTRPTPAQMKALARLTAYLMQTYRIPASRVIGHGDAKPTDCPGHNMSVASVRRMAQAIVDSGAAADPALARGSAGSIGSASADQ